MIGNSPESAQGPISAPKPVRWYTRPMGDWPRPRRWLLTAANPGEPRRIRYGGLFVEDIPRTPPREPGWSWTDWDPAFDPPEDVTWEQITLLDPIRHAQHQHHPWEPPE